MHKEFQRIKSNLSRHVDKQRMHERRPAGFPRASGHKHPGFLRQILFKYPHSCLMSTKKRTSTIRSIMPSASNRSFLSFGASDLLSRSAFGSPPFHRQTGPLQGQDSAPFQYRAEAAGNLPAKEKLDPLIWHEMHRNLQLQQNLFSTVNSGLGGRSNSKMTNDSKC